MKAALLPALALALSALAAVSCLTTAPAEPPPVPPLGPTIIQDAVYPPSNAYLQALPPQPFVVPVRVFDPNRSITCRVFVDFDPGIDNSQFATGNIPAANCPDTPPALDGGPTLLQFSLTSTNLVDPTACHVIQCYVADSFAINSMHTPGDSLGADSVTWQYAPNGPGGCEQFDGGDGAAPPDAPIDALPITPDVVGSPP